MTPSNLSICFAPSLFYFPEPAGRQPKRRLSIGKRKGRRPTGLPDLKELLWQKASQQCLTDLIVHCQEYFHINFDEIPFLKLTTQSFSVDPQWMLSKRLAHQELTNPMAEKSQISRTRVPSLCIHKTSTGDGELGPKKERLRANSVQSGISGLMSELGVPIALGNDRLSCDDFLAQENLAQENLQASQSMYCKHWRRQGEGGISLETENNCCRKIVLFLGLYKTTKFLENRING